MKKTYICPQTDVTMVQSEQFILAGSVIGNVVSDNPAAEDLEVLSFDLNNLWNE